jgi:hypothetical protein
MYERFAAAMAQPAPATATGPPNGRRVHVDYFNMVLTVDGQQLNEPDHVHAKRLLKMPGEAWAMDEAPATA